MPTYGVWIRNGRNIKVVDDETDILVVRDNFSWITPKETPSLDMNFSYIEDEINAFQLRGNVSYMTFSNLGNIGRMGIPNNVYARDSITHKEVAVRHRTLAKTSKMGGSGSGEWGMRLWSSAPRKLMFDSGHKIFQPRAFHSLRYNQTFYAPANSWIIPLNWFKPEHAFINISCVRESATGWRIKDFYNSTTGIPTNIPLAQFWIMDNV